LMINRIGATKVITNPGVAGFYTLTVKTSVEPTAVTSKSYAISDAPPVSNITVRLSPDTVNWVSSDTVSFRVSSAGALAVGQQIVITFPINTLVPASISAANVRVANAPANPSTFNAVSFVTTNASTRQVTVTLQTAISNSDSVRVAIVAAAGLENPSVFGNYTLNVRTTTQPINGTSASYTLLKTTTTITNPMLSIVPNDVSLIGHYTYTFNTGAHGRLRSGTSYIALLFPDDITFTQGSPTPSKITVNGVSAQSVNYKPRVLTNPDTLEIIVPTSVTIGNLAAVTVVIDSSAGIQNTSSRNPLNYGVYTSVETGVIGTDVTLPVFLTYFRGTPEPDGIRLDWRTESEIDNAYWIIERAELPDSLSLEKAAFQSLASMRGQNTTPSFTVYQYLDNSAEPGKTYAYRLTDISLQGTAFAHDPIVVTHAIPGKFALHRNYPNPFNPTTQIRFELPVTSHVDIRVYNVLGQEVQKLMDSDVGPGFHAAIWDGRNKQGRTVSSGVYIYRMVAKSTDGSRKFVTSRKMMMLK